METSNRAIYRVWQFWQVVTARPLAEEELSEIAAILNPKELELFLRQDSGGQQHALRVMRTLKEAGHEEKDLLAAALLHDAGKTKALSRWWDRSMVVLGQAMLPARSTRWASRGKEGWRRPFAIKKYHPEWGAAAAAACGSSPLTVRLIRRHQERLEGAGQGQEERLLALLQWADNQN